MTIYFRSLYFPNSLVCTTLAGNKGLYPVFVDGDDNPEYCSVHWTKGLHDPKGASLNEGGVQKFEGFDVGGLADVPESSAPALIQALNSPDRLALVIKRSILLSFPLPEECQVEDRNSNPITYPIVVPIDGKGSIC